MEKRVLLAIILSMAVLFLWQSIFPPPKPKRVESVPPQQEEQAVVPREETGYAAEEAKEVVAVPPSSSLTRPERSTLPPEKEIVIDTELYHAVFSSRGARLKRLALRRYKNKAAQPGICFVFPFSLLPGNKRTHYDSSLKELVNIQGLDNYPLYTDFEGPELGSFAEAPFTASKDFLELDSYSSQGKIVFSWTSQAGVSFIKTFTFSNENYFIGYDFTVANNSQNPLEGSPVVEWTSAAKPENEKKKGGLFGGGMGVDIQQVLYLMSDEINKIEVTEVQEKEVFSGNIKWAGLEDKYFLSSLIPAEPQDLTLSLFRGKSGEVAFRLTSPPAHIPPNDQQTFLYSLYLGPKDMDHLEKGSGGLGRVLDFGWFLNPVAKPMLFILKLFYKFIPNYGLAIIFLSVGIKLIFWPLTHKGQKSMKQTQSNMKKLQPKLAELKEKYKDNKDELNRRTMELYKTHKVNPIGGCLPMLVQMPIFFALYRVLLNSIELRHAPFVSFWINDLAAKDPTYISPLIMGASMFVQQKMTPTAGDPTQAKMMLFMPVVFTFMFLSFPSGLVFYWLVSNLLSITQQYYVNKNP
jgi:YidC/Oxa1 family membrane protein insertase